ncbi:nicotinamide-nucleotide amidohydrolase family protein [Aquipuribacter hungaricus]|uniref:CinA family protein n=1 Tax=Aquipuribacter hungaricus TaxID=545624 RepID=A0ABV7WNN8_9MICO
MTGAHDPVAGPGHDRDADPASDPADVADLAAQVVRRLVGAGTTLGVAESLTGGALSAALVSVPGASAAYRGAVVAYATDLKAAVLGVPQDLLDAHGAVHPDVAAAMAAGAARVTGSTWGLATTGVAGPTPQDGRPVGAVHVAVAGPVARVQSLRLPGGREQVRRASTAAALRLLLSCLPG